MIGYIVLLELVIILISIILIYLSYRFYRESKYELFPAAKWFAAAFAILFFSRLFNIAYEFSPLRIINVAGQVFLIATFVLLIIGMVTHPPGDDQ